MLSIVSLVAVSLIRILQLAPSSTTTYINPCEYGTPIDWTDWTQRIKTQAAGVLCADYWVTNTVPYPTHVRCWLKGDCVFQFQGLSIYECMEQYLPARQAELCSCWTQYVDTDGDGLEDNPGFPNLDYDQCVADVMAKYDTLFQKCVDDGIARAKAAGNCCGNCTFQQVPL